MNKKRWNQEYGFSLKQTMVYDPPACTESWAPLQWCIEISCWLLAPSVLSSWDLKRPVQSLPICMQQVPTSGFPLNLFFLCLLNVGVFQDSVLIHSQASPTSHIHPRLLS